MASQRQIEANRRNGSKGGPKTEEGKAKSRANSSKHGLTATTITVMRDETQEEYERILSGFRESFQPADAMEDALVVRLAQTEWRTLRSRHVETEMLEISADMERAYARKIIPNCPEDLSAHGALAASFLKNPEERWKTYMRYDGAISREFFRTLDALRRLQNDRKKSAPPQSKPLVMVAGAASHSTHQVSENGIRFVSQAPTSAPNPAETTAVSAAAAAQVAPKVARASSRRAKNMQRLIAKARSLRSGARTAGSEQRQVINL